MEKALWTPTAGWMVAIGAAFALAQFAPDERALLGRVPPANPKGLDQRQMALSHGLELPDCEPVLHYAHYMKALVWPLRRVRVIEIGGSPCAGAALAGKVLDAK